MFVFLSWWFLFFNFFICFLVLLYFCLVRFMLNFICLIFCMVLLLFSCVIVWVLCELYRFFMLCIFCLVFFIFLLVILSLCFRRFFLFFKRVYWDFNLEIWKKVVLLEFVFFILLYRLIKINMIL